MKSIGRVIEVATNYLKIEINDLNNLHYNHDGHAYSSKGINEYISIKNSIGDTFIYQTIKSEDKESILSPLENSKVYHSGIITCISIGIINENSINFNLINYPFLNDEAFLANRDELNIIYSTTPNVNSIRLGHIEEKFIPNIDPNNLLTRHTCVLGNTGSGKSTTIKKILEEVKSLKPRNLTIHVLDVHDEYQTHDTKHSQLIDIIKDYRIPISSLDLQDWINLVKPAEQVQLPILLISLKIASLIKKPNMLKWIKLYLAYTLFNRVQTDVLGKRTKIIFLLRQEEIDISHYTQYGNFSSSHHESEFKNSLIHMMGKYFPISTHDMDNFFLEALNESDYSVSSFNNLNTALELAFLYEESKGNSQARSYSASMETRLKAIAEKFSHLIVNCPEDEIINNDTIVAIYSASSLDDDLLLFFSSYLIKKKFNQALNIPKSERPINIFLLEEAHRYVSRAREKNSEYEVEIFRKISREGRKFGCFLYLSSQRPSELSSTVLSQCNNFIIHRIKNNQDLDYMSASIPYITTHQISRISYLPTGTGLFVGDLFPIPVEITMTPSDSYKAASSPEISWRE